MQLHIARTLEDIRGIDELAKGETWEHARKFLAKAPTNPFADHLRWMEEDGRPVACVQIFLHQYPIGCARIGMCLPEYPFVPPELRGQGGFKRLMADLFEWMRRNGYPLAYDHGDKGLYTRFGFAPCFHHTMVLIRTADAVNVQSTCRAVQATDAEIAAHEELFRQPFPLGRGLQCRDERWRPDPRCVRIVRANGTLEGFVVLGQVLVGRKANGSGFAALTPPEGGGMLTITDGWSAHMQAAAGLLRTVAEEARGAGYQWVRMNCRIDDPLVRIGVLAGGELRHCAAQERDHTRDGEDVDAFYLADLRLAVEQLLPELTARWRAFHGEAPSQIRLMMDDEEAMIRLDRELTIVDQPVSDAPCIRLPRKAMTQAIMGYATPTELSLIHEGCELPAPCRDVVDALFPALRPRLIHENWAFAKAAEFGLVP